MTTVKDLIGQLAMLDPDLPVFCKGYEGGHGDAKITVVFRSVIRNINKEWYYGPHELSRPSKEDKGQKVVILKIG